MKCGGCKKVFCFDNEDYQGKCGGYTEKSWSTLGIRRKNKVKCCQCKKPDNLAASDDENEENTYAEKSKEEYLKLFNAWRPP